MQILFYEALLYSIMALIDRNAYKLSVDNLLVRAPCLFNYSSGGALHGYERALHDTSLLQWNCMIMGYNVVLYAIIIMLIQILLMWHVLSFWINQQWHHLRTHGWRSTMKHPDLLMTSVPWLPIEALFHNQAQKLCGILQPSGEK